MPADTPPDAAADSSPRFAFGRNWASFLRWLDDDRIAAAEARMRELIGLDSLAGKTFIDIGSGSGLMSLCAMRLGATAVRSFDYDADSVACTDELRRRYYPDDPRWVVSRGDATDDAFMASLGTFDVVYSFGVLHHTGRMWHSIDLATRAVAPGGRFAIAIYNHQGWRSRVWWWIKRIYVGLPQPLRFMWFLMILPRLELPLMAKDLLRLRPPWRHWQEYRRERGMSLWHDFVDWVGGFPFEVATPEQIFDCFRERGFVLERLRTCAGGIGTNHFRFVRHAPAD